MSKIKKVYSARDMKIEAFGPLMVFSHVGEMARVWEGACNDPNSGPGKYPEDYALFEVGEFNEDDGVITPLSPIKLVMTALDVRKKLPQDISEKAVRAVQ